MEICMAAAGLCNFDRGPRSEGALAWWFMPAAVSKATATASSSTPRTMFYQLAEASKGPMMAVGISSILGVAYTTFAFFRYTGATSSTQMCQWPTPSG